MIITGLLGWLVVRQGLTRRICGAADDGLFISFATYPSRCPSALESAVVSCNYDGFISGLYKEIRDVCVARVTSGWCMKRVETYQTEHV